MTIRVVVADDHELVRTGFAVMIDAHEDMTVVAGSDDGTTAIEAVRVHRPDVALLDIRMPVMDGIEAAKIICADTDTKVIILTTFDTDEYLYGALHAGASGFLLKDVRREDLIHAIRVAHRGDALLAPTLTRRLIDDTVRRRAIPRAPAVLLERLTARERETLMLLGRGMSNAEIAIALTVSEHTAKTHVSSILTKLGLRDRTQAVITAYETGLIEPGS